MPASPVGPAGQPLEVETDPPAPTPPSPVESKPSPGESDTPFDGSPGTGLDLSGGEGRRPTDGGWAQDAGPTGQEAGLPLVTIEIGARDEPLV